jgi:hypothetical protein
VKGQITGLAFLGAATFFAALTGLAIGAAATRLTGCIAALAGFTIGAAAITFTGFGLGVGSASLRITSGMNMGFRLQGLFDAGSRFEVLGSRFEPRSFGLVPRACTWGFSWVHLPQR